MGEGRNDAAGGFVIPTYSWLCCLLIIWWMLHHASDRFFEAKKSLLEEHRCLFGGAKSGLGHANGGRRRLGTPNGGTCEKKPRLYWPTI